MEKLELQEKEGKEVQVVMEKVVHHSILYTEEEDLRVIMVQME